MSFDRDLLAAFAAVARYDTVGRAAVALNSTQPTVSRHIRALERQLGHMLFDRTAQGMSLTPAGEELLPRVRLLLHEMDLAREAMDELKGLKRGTLRVGGVPSVTRGILPGILADVARRAPRLRIEVLEGSEDQLGMALAHRLVDVIFTAQAPHEVDTVPIGKQEFADRCVVFCRSKHPMRHADTVTLAHLVEQSWALPHPGSTPRLQFERRIRELGLATPRIALQTDSVDVMVALVSCTEMLGWLPLALLGSKLNSGEVVLLEAPPLEWQRTFRPYRRAGGSFPTAAQFLVDALESCGGH